MTSLLVNNNSLAALDVLVDMAIEQTSDRHRKDAISRIGGFAAVDVPIGPTVLSRVLLLLAGPYDTSLVDGSSFHLNQTVPISLSRSEWIRDEEMSLIPLLTSCRLGEAVLSAASVTKGISLSDDSYLDHLYHVFYTRLSRMAVARERRPDEGARLVGVLAHVMQREIAAQLSHVDLHSPSAAGTVAKARAELAELGAEEEPMLVQTLVTPASPEPDSGVPATPIFSGDSYDSSDSRTSSRSSSRRSGRRSRSHSRPSGVRYGVQPAAQIPSQTVDEFVRSYLFVSTLSAILCADEYAGRALLRGRRNPASTSRVGVGRSGTGAQMLRRLEDVTRELIRCIGIAGVSGYEVGLPDSDFVGPDAPTAMLEEKAGTDPGTVMYIKMLGTLAGQLWNTACQLGFAAQRRMVGAAADEFRVVGSYRSKELFLASLSGSRTCARLTCTGTCMDKARAFRLALVDRSLADVLAGSSSNVPVVAKRWISRLLEADAQLQVNDEGSVASSRSEGPATASNTSPTGETKPAPVEVDHAEGMTLETCLQHGMVPCLAKVAVGYLAAHAPIHKSAFGCAKKSLDVQALYLAHWAEDAIVCGVEPLPLGAFTKVENDPPQEQDAAFQDDDDDILPCDTEPWLHVTRAWFYKRVRSWLWEQRLRVYQAGNLLTYDEAATIGANLDSAAEALCKAAGPIELPDVEAAESTVESVLEQQLEKVRADAAAARARKQAKARSRGSDLRDTPLSMVSGSRRTSTASSTFGESDLSEGSYDDSGGSLSESLSVADGGSPGTGDEHDADADDVVSMPSAKRPKLSAEQTSASDDESVSVRAQPGSLSSSPFFAKPRTPPSRRPVPTSLDPEVRIAQDHRDGQIAVLVDMGFSLEAAAMAYDGVEGAPDEKTVELLLSRLV